jgi:molybdate transport repressor ModE-like protein
MLQIEIETVWRFHKEGSPQSVVVMLGVLNEIRKTGKITSAAADAHLSYRHVWNLIEHWSQFFGVPLVEAQRGKGSKLTAFGEKLVWAGERMHNKARFVNRDHDSGTRLLFDQLLALHGIDEARINGAQQIEFTHAAVAAYVASDMADVSFGVEAAARQFGLDFIRILTEDYFFVCRQAFLETEPMRRMLDIMKGREFHKAVAALPGYKATDTGVVHTVREFLDRVDAFH